MKFVKMHGCGNDFIILNGLSQEIPSDWSSLGKKLCDRHFGIGADGVLLVLPSDIADIRMVIINSDGSEAQMCGNGLRCFAAFVYHNNLVKTAKMTVQTGAGIMIPEIITADDGKTELVRVDLGEPHLVPEEIPTTLTGDGTKVVSSSLEVQGKKLKVTCVSMGNPHAVIFWDDQENIPIDTLGPILESHPVFPEKANIEFAVINNKNEITMRVYERGCGETLACGTGGAATTVSAVLNGLCENNVTIHLLGGDLIYHWAENNHVFMTGPFTYVAKGEILL